MRTTLILLAVLAGCNGIPKGEVPPDAPGYSCVRSFCDHGNRVYFAKCGYGAALAVVPQGCPE
jgi:hypothetical protein